MANELFFKSLLNKYSNLNGITLNSNLLSYQNESIKIDNIYLETFFKQNISLSSNLENLNASDVFKIIKYHCKYNNEKKNYLNIDENIIIRNMRVIKHHNKGGLINDYIYIIDEKGETYFDKCDYALEAFDYFQKNSNNNFNQITVKMLNDYLISLKKDDNYSIKEIYNLYEIKDYLIEPLKGKLDNFIKKIEELEVKENKTIEEQQLLNQFKEYTKKIDEKNKEYLKVRKVNAGYFNGFILIGIVTLLGIILSVLLIRGM